MIALLAALALAQDPVFSGPQKGEKTPAFKVLDMNGPNAGKEVDYVADWKGAPTCFVFVHELTRPGAQLFRRIDDYGAANKDRLKTLIVSLQSDLNEGERRLPATLKAVQIKSIVGISVDGKEGPGAWGLNKDMTITVVLAKDNVVTASFAILSPNETDFPKMQAELDKLTAPALDTPEQMKAEILRLRAEIAALRTELEAIKRAQARPARPEMERPKEPLPGKMASDPTLIGCCRRLIQKDASDADIDATIKEIDAHIDGKDDLKAQMKDAIILLDHLGYGNDYSKKAREKYKK